MVANGRSIAERRVGRAFIPPSVNSVALISSQQRGEHGFTRRSVRKQLGEIVVHSGRYGFVSAVELVSERKGAVETQGSITHGNARFSMGQRQSITKRISKRRNAGRHARLRMAICGGQDNGECVMYATQRGGAASRVVRSVESVDTKSS